MLYVKEKEEQGSLDKVYYQKLQENRQRQANQSETATQSEKIEQSQEKPQPITISLSKEGLEMAEKQREYAEKHTYQEQLEDSKESADAFKDLAKMMEIARRIANGDKVPSSDQQKLMEFNAKLFQAAKAAANMRQNKHPKEYKFMFEEEAEEGSGEASESDGGIDTEIDVTTDAPDENVVEIV